MTTAAQSVAETRTMALAMFESNVPCFFQLMDPSCEKTAAWVTYFAHEEATDCDHDMAWPVQLLKVTACTGNGPFTLTVSPVTRWDRWLVRMWALRRRLRNWWLETRCLPDSGWCWRKATTDCLCDRHWLLAIEDGAKDL